MLSSSLLSVPRILISFLVSQRPLPFALSLNSHSSLLVPVDSFSLTTSALFNSHRQYYCSRQKNNFKNHPLSRSIIFSDNFSHSWNNSIRFMNMKHDDNKSGDGDMKVLGVIGGIGSGKSTACELLVSQLGCIERIDADKLGHLVYSPGSDALKEIVNEFGPSLLIGDELNRKALGAIVFADPKAMKKLEAIVWPHIRNLACKQLEEIRMKKQQEKNKVGVVVLEAAILLDAGWEDMCDAVWSVRVSPEVAQERLMTTRGLTETEAMSRIQAQKSCRGIGNLDDEYENGTVHTVIENDGNLDQLQQKLQNALTSFLQQ